ncbi:MAG TPA: hypothetical protein VFF35_04105, partial [Bacteroidia bacterium]|nr:hypothetical protein [Bacteroidia bacterium]
MRLIFIFYFLFIYSQLIHGQKIFYQDIFNGGVTGAGFSQGIGNGGEGEGNIEIFIEPGSLIRKAFLICYRRGKAESGEIVLNSISYELNYTNQVANNYNVSPSFSAANINAIHAIDITEDINPTQNVIPVFVPKQNTIHKYGSFYILVLYEKAVLPEVTVSLIINETDISPVVNYFVQEINPVINNNPVGFSIHSDILWDTIFDGSFIYINGNYLGLIGGSDNSTSIQTGSGVKGHFYYQNNLLFGLDDDTPNSSMAGSDGLADVSTYFQSNTTSLNFNIKYQTPSTVYNNYLSFYLAYTTSCNPFTTTITKDTTICSGTTAQLTATGGINYEWLPQQNLSCYNCPNPVFTGQKTTTYTCRIWSTDSCSKVLPVRVIVKEPRPDTVNVTNGICGDNNGSFKLGQIQNGTAPFMYSIAGQTNTTGNFTGLGAGTYTYKVTDAMGCVFSDTVSINETNPVKAGYLTQKFKDDLLKIGFINNSKNATHYIWVFPNGDTLYSENFTQLFDSGGTYEVMLIAYNTYPHCSDTVMHTINIASTLLVLAPNVFTPNGDGKNDT